MEPTAATADGRGDRELFASLYPGLRRFAAVVAASDRDPDDLVQEALARTLRGGPLGRLDAPTAYLRRAILNEELSRRRADVRHRRVDPVLVPAERTMATYPSDLSVLDALDPLDRALVYLTAVEGWTFADVAALLDRPEASLRVRASRARARLRDLIKGADVDG